MELQQASSIDRDQNNQQFQQEKRKNQVIKEEMRGHHFSYGKAKPTYASMSAMQFQEHNLAAVNE